MEKGNFDLVKVSFPKTAVSKRGADPAEPFPCLEAHLSAQQQPLPRLPITVVVLDQIKCLAGVRTKKLKHF